MATASTSDKTSSEDTLSGPLMAVLPVLLAEGRTDEVLAAVAALVARNETLERKFAALMHKGFKSNEGVSTAQAAEAEIPTRAATLRQRDRSARGGAGMPEVCGTTGGDRMRRVGSRRVESS
ncbi:MAG: hypothetical protein JKY37_25835 [Nannocystaceae bacterium]|nr:hypothetical protein [Nannocystaceae bacterium]